MKMFRIVKFPVVTFGHSLHASIKYVAIFGRRILGYLVKYLHTQNKHRVEIW